MNWTQAPCRFLLFQIPAHCLTVTACTHITSNLRDRRGRHYWSRGGYTWHAAIPRDWGLYLCVHGSKPYIPNILESVIRLGQPVYQANNGTPLAVFPPSSPPIFPTPENVFDGIVKASCEFVMTAPAVVEVHSFPLAISIT